MKSLLFALALVLIAQVANAQSTYPISTAKLTWTWVKGTQVGINDGIPTEFHVKCGGVAGQYTKNAVVPYVASPTNTFSVLAQKVTGGSGVYYCVVMAATATMETTASNEVFFSGEASLSTPTSLGVSP